MTDIAFCVLVVRWSSLKLNEVESHLFKLMVAWLLGFMAYQPLLVISNQIPISYKSVLFQTIQFSISTPFSSIRPIHRNLSGTTALGQSGSGSNGNDGVLRISHVRLFSVITRPLIGEGLTPLQRSNRCILQPQPTWQLFK